MCNRFARVCECVHKVTGSHCAVKIIDKYTLDPNEKELLSTEIASEIIPLVVVSVAAYPPVLRIIQLYSIALRSIGAVLKLVNHPNIIRMEGLYESRQYIYIVMEVGP